MSVQPQLGGKGVPKAPRAMLRGSGDLQNDEVTLYKYLNLLHSLDEFQGRGRVDRGDKKGDDTRYTTKELRRSFLDSISYLCDINPKGGTVTAAAIRKFYCKDGVQGRLYLAANEPILDRVHHFVERMLRDLEDITPKNHGMKKRKLLRESLDLGRQRLNYYHGKVLFHLKKCDQDIRILFRDQEILTWIETIKVETDLQRLSALCYHSREGKLDELKRKASEHRDIAELTHYIGRLGAHEYAVSTIITAYLKVPILRKIKVQILPSALVTPINLPAESVNFHTVCQEISGSPHLRHSGHDLYTMLYNSNFLSGFTLPSKLVQTSAFVTRVHAELQIVDYFSRKRLEFIEDDKYVGCSKPACYFCHLWIRLHPGGFEVPASHKKVILGCRGPDIDVAEDVNGNGARIRRDQYKRLTREIIRDIEEQVHIEQFLNRCQHLSSDGSSRAPSIMTRISIFN